MKKHYCEDYVSREIDANSNRKCDYCGNDWIFGKGWVKPNPSYRKPLKEIRRALYEKQIFFKQIDKYNKEEKYFAHFVMLNKNEVMEIIWDKGKWEYSIHKLERLK